MKISILLLVALKDSPSSKTIYSVEEEIRVWKSLAMDTCSLFFPINRDPAKPFLKPNILPGSSSVITKTAACPLILSKAKLIASNVL